MTGHRPASTTADHVVSLDGKVFSSPVATLETERLNRRTGELIPVRQDPARQRYGEGGVEGIVYGTKFAIASTRSPLANHRVTLGIAHFDATTKGGEGRVFTDLALDLASRTSGIHAFTADGAWRGVHLNDVQSQTGCGVIAPPRHRAARNGGIVVDNRGHAAQPLPWSERRIPREANCAGHSLWAAAGTLFEQIVTASGESEFRELPRHQTKRDKTRRKDGSERHQFYGRYSLPCPGHPDHDWWEPLLATAADEVARFNRCEYLRIAPTTTENHRRLYGMRQDSESSTPSSKGRSTANACLPGSQESDDGGALRSHRRQCLDPSGLALGSRTPTLRLARRLRTPLLVARPQAPDDQDLPSISRPGPPEEGSHPPGLLE